MSRSPSGLPGEAGLKPCATRNGRAANDGCESSEERTVMVKRMILMVVVMIAIIAGLGFVKFKQFQAMAEQFAAMQPPPDAVTTIVARQQEWPNTLNAIGTVAAVQGVTVSADLPGIVDRIAFDS